METEGRGHPGADHFSVMLFTIILPQYCPSQNPLFAERPIILPTRSARPIAARSKLAVGRSFRQGSELCADLREDYLIRGKPRWQDRL